MKQVEAGLLKDLYDLLEEEIFQYHLLVEELKKESEHLRRRSVESLTESPAEGRSADHDPVESGSPESRDGSPGRFSGPVLRPVYHPGDY